MRRAHPMRRSGTLKRGRALRRAKPAAAIASDVWRDGLAARCQVCAAESKLTGRPSACGGGRIEGHHIIAKQSLRRRGLHAFLLDHRNRLAICPWRHERHTKRTSPIPRACLPASAWEFAAELDLEWMLERDYPLTVCEEASP